MTPLSDEALDRLFREARTFPAFLDKPVDRRHAAQDLRPRDAWAPRPPTPVPRASCFVRSPAASAPGSRPALSAGNHDKTMTAPVTAILAYDLEFYEHLPKLFSHVDARSWFVGKHDHIVTTAFRNSTLQGGYFMLAARALGLDCGGDVRLRQRQGRRRVLSRRQVRSPTSSSTSATATRSKLLPRHPRLTFEEACTDRLTAPRRRKRGHAHPVHVDRPVRDRRHIDRDVRARPDARARADPGGDAAPRRAGGSGLRGSRPGAGARRCWSSSCSDVGAWSPPASC